MGGVERPDGSFDWLHSACDNTDGRVPGLPFRPSNASLPRIIRSAARGCGLCQRRVTSDAHNLHELNAACDTTRRAGTLGSCCGWGREREIEKER